MKDGILTSCFILNRKVRICQDSFKQDSETVFIISYHLYFQLPTTYTVCFRDLAKSANGGSILSSSQFLILPQLPRKIKLASKVVKVDSKIIISLTKIPETLTLRIM